MRIQRISNTRQQNFGDVIVLEPSGNLNWRDIDSMTAGISCGKNWVTTDKARLVMYNGAEQAEIQELEDSLKLLATKHQESVHSRIWERIVAFGQSVKPIIVKSVKDLQGINGFEELTVVALDDGLSGLRSLLGNL